YSQTRPPLELTFGGLRDQVARARAGLRRLGVSRGDRVAAYLPNIPETLVAFLATASLGAIWCCCAPEFGARSVIDRFRQVEPKVLLAVAGYRLRQPRHRPACRGRRRARGVANRRARGARALRQRGAARRAGLAWPAGRAGTAGVRTGCVRAPAVRAVLIRYHRQAEGDRPRPRRRPRRTPQEPRTELGPAAR